MTFVDKMFLIKDAPPEVHIENKKNCYSNNITHVQDQALMIAYNIWGVVCWFVIFLAAIILKIQSAVHGDIP